MVFFIEKDTERKNNEPFFRVLVPYLWLYWKYHFYYKDIWNWEVLIDGEAYICKTKSQVEKCKDNDFKNCKIVEENNLDIL